MNVIVRTVDPTVLETILQDAVAQNTITADEKDEVLSAVKGATQPSLDSVAKALAAAIAVFAAIGTGFKGALFTNLAPAANWTLALAVFLLGTSLIFALWSVPISSVVKPAKRSSADQKKGLKRAVFLFGASLLITSFVPIVSLIAVIFSSPMPKQHGIAYSVDSTGTMIANAAGSGLEPFSIAELLAVDSTDSRIHGSAGGFVDSVGRLSIELRLPSQSCLSATRVSKLKLMKSDTLLNEADVLCPTH